VGEDKPMPGRMQQKT